jgi:predicted Zn-dependent peptidase
LELAAVRAPHAATFGADALLVAAGQITRSELDGLLARSLADWRPRAARPARPPPGPPVGARPRLVLVDRPEAPQAVVSVVLPGVAAGAPEAPLVELVNTALGGSFTSRLNQNLREDRNWTYGAGSAFAHTRGVGPFVARAEVLTHVTALSVREVLGELEKMAAGGLTAGEHQKVRARDLTDLMETHETVSGVAARLAELGTLDLPPDFDAAASRARQAATRDELQRLAARCFQTSAASVVVVGPASELVAQLRTLELGEPERWSADGRPLP